MNEFELYSSLKNIKDFIEHNTKEKEFVQELNTAMQQIENRLYRVAVIGEFKRGKSSLINTLLGAKVLPTDILPATAVVNRISYNTTSEIILNYKNGRKETTTVENLDQYATQLDPEKAKVAGSLNEIIVHYPTPFLDANNMELLDTPGLNDNEQMTQTTFDVLGKIDTAIVVISAVIPLSQTEEDLVCKLLEQNDIYNLIFVATFIDRVSDEKKEQDRAVDMIRKRLKDDTYDRFVKNHSDKPELIKKAKRILSEPKLFPVSSKIAMDGILTNNHRKTRESRFDVLNTELKQLLVENRRKDLYSKIARLVNDAKTEFPQWLELTISAEYIDIQKENEKNINRRNNINRRKSDLETDLKKFEVKLSQKDIPLQANDISFFTKNVKPESCFIKELSAIERRNYAPLAVINALKAGVHECNSITDNACKFIKETLATEMLAVEKSIDERNKICGIKSFESTWQKIEAQFPKFELTFEAICSNVTNIMADIIPQITKNYTAAYKKYTASLLTYINTSWKAVLNKQEDSIIKTASQSCESKQQKIEEQLENHNNDSQIKRSTLIPQFTSLIKDIKL